MRKICNVIVLLFFTLQAIAQVGINNTDPKATLDITASNISAPSNVDGILIPRIDNFPTANPGADQDGMLVYVTGNGAPTRGFYYWDNALNNWVNVIASNDADFYEVGTTNAPNNINDDIYTQGRLAIGKTTANYTLDIEENSNNQALNISQVATSNAGTVSAARISQGGTNNSFLNGLYINNTNTGSGAHRGVVVALSENSSGTKSGTNNFISNGNGWHYGVNNSLSGSGSGPRFGMYNWISGTGTDNHSGTYNYMTSDGTGNKFGTYNYINSSGSGNFYGISSLVAGTPASGNASHYGNFSHVASEGTGSRYAYYAFLQGSGTGNKYGVYSEISSTSASNNQYAIYGSALKSGANIWAGYFLGDVYIGTDTTNGYSMPATDGTANQVMQTNGAGNVNWVDSNSYWSRTGSELDVATSGDDINFSSDQTSITFPATTGTPASMIHLFESGSANSDRMVFSHSPTFSSWGLMYRDSNDSFRFLGGGIDRVMVNLTGSTPLVVNGTAQATNFQSSTTIYPDYVFENYFTGKSKINPEYQFQNLELIEAFIKDYGHLPGVKSYEEVLKNDMQINLAETSVKNLEKIEELFLYAIQLKKENEQLKKNQKVLEDRVGTIEKLLLDYKRQ